MPGHNGVFAHRFPIAFSCCYTRADAPGFYRRRFDLFAINRLLRNRQLNRLTSLLVLS
jgi:hypothetical protein